MVEIITSRHRYFGILGNESLRLLLKERAIK